MKRKELDTDLSGEVVAVTGGGGVLCRAMAAALARHGASVAVLDVSAEAAAQAAGEIKAGGGRAVAVPCDVLDREQLLRAAETVESALGAPTALINGAGGNKAEATTSPERTFFPPRASIVSVQNAMRA